MLKILRATRLADLDALEGGGYAGVAFGAEFCACRLPELDDVAKARERCAELGISFSLMTPLTREAHFERVVRWLIQAADQGDEVSFNDLGLLHAFKTAAIRHTAGRLLSRQRRDHRVAGMIDASPEDAAALRQSLWNDPETLASLAEMGVTRVELDALPWGAARPDLPPGMALTVCGPWAPVTLTPSCPWSTDPLDCPAPCAGASPVRQESDEDPAPLWSRGNTLFLKVEEDVAAQAEALGADRLLWAESIPG